MSLKEGQKVSGTLVTIYGVVTNPTSESNRYLWYLEEQDAKYAAAGFRTLKEQPKTANIYPQREDASIVQRLVLKLNGTEEYYVLGSSGPARILTDGEQRRAQVSSNVFLVLTPLEREMVEPAFRR